MPIYVLGACTLNLARAFIIQHLIHLSLTIMKADSLFSSYISLFPAINQYLAIWINVLKGTRDPDWV